MMTDAEFRDAAVAEFEKTTDAYPTWVRKGRPSSSHWAKGFDFLAQIGKTPPPPAGFTVRAMYDASGAGKAVNWPAIAAQGFNVLICSADDSASLAAVKKTGGRAWVMPGVWTGSGFSTSDAQAVALAKSAVASGTVAGFYLADEPTYSIQNAGLVAARSQLLKQACPGVETLIAYYDAGSVGRWKSAVDAFALDVYPSRSNWDMSLIPNLAAAADAAGLRYYGIVGAFAATNYPLPTAAQLKTMVDLWAGTRQVGSGCYAWGPTGGSAQQLEKQAALLAVLKAANG